MDQIEVYEELMRIIPCYLCYIKDTYGMEEFGTDCLVGQSPFAACAGPLAHGLAELARAKRWTRNTSDRYDKPTYVLTEEGAELAGAYTLIRNRTRL